MSDDIAPIRPEILEACKATDPDALRRRIMDPNLPKNEAEQWARAEILKLTEAREKAIAECRTAVQGLAYLSDFPHPHETLTRADKALKALLNGTAK